MNGPERTQRQRMLDVLRASSVPLPSAKVAARSTLSQRFVNRELSKCRKLGIVLGEKRAGQLTEWRINPEAPLAKRGPLSGVDDRVTAEKLQWLRTLQGRPMFRDVPVLAGIIADYAKAVGVR